MTQDLTVDGTIIAREAAKIIVTGGHCPKTTPMATTTCRSRMQLIFLSNSLGIGVANRSISALVLLSKEPGMAEALDDADRIVRWE